MRIIIPVAGYGKRFEPFTKNNQKSYFDTFGFLFLKNLFTQNEIMRMASASEKIFELNPLVLNYPDFLYENNLIVCER